MSRSDVESKAGLCHVPAPGCKRLRLTVAYCGTPWKGWQSQEGGGGVQDEINAAMIGHGFAASPVAAVHLSGL